MSMTIYWLPLSYNYWFRIYDIKYGVPTDREIEFPDDESSTGL